jgi:hypothetical protein
MRVIQIGVGATYVLKVNFDVGSIGKMHLGELRCIAKRDSRNLAKPWIGFHHAYRYKQQY